MSKDKPKKLNDGLSSELFKKGLSSSNLQSGLGKTPPKAKPGSSSSTDTSKNGK